MLQKQDFDVDALSKSELRMLLSVMEGELEARDLVIEALRVSRPLPARPTPHASLSLFTGPGVKLPFLNF